MLQKCSDIDKLNRLKERVKKTRIYVLRESLFSKHWKQPLKPLKLKQRIHKNHQQNFFDLPVHHLIIPHALFVKRMVEKAVEYPSAGQSLLKVAKTLHDEGLLLSLNYVPNTADPAANDVQYHLVCRVKGAAKCSREKEAQLMQEIKDTNVVI